MGEILYDTGSLIKAYKQRKRLTGYTTILNVVEFPKLLDSVEQKHEACNY